MTEMTLKYENWSHTFETLTKNTTSPYAYYIPNAEVEK